MQTCQPRAACWHAWTAAALCPPAAARSQPSSRLSWGACWPDRRNRRCPSTAGASACSAAATVAGLTSRRAAAGPHRGCCYPVALGGRERGQLAGHSGLRARQPLSLRPPEARCPAHSPHHHHHHPQHHPQQRACRLPQQHARRRPQQQPQQHPCHQPGHPAAARSLRRSRWAACPPA